jgi:alkyldihydroxyacetonephosphate synthase
MVRLSNPKETVTQLALAGHEKKIGLLKTYLRVRRTPLETACMCLVGFTGKTALVRANRRQVISVFKNNHGVHMGKVLGNAWKKNRFRSAYLRNALWDRGYGVDTLETAVTWDRVTPTMAEIEKSIISEMEIWDENIHVFSHLSHVYPSGSSIYTTFVFRLADTPQDTLNRWKAVKQSACATIVNAGGTISHQHGVGIDHRDYLEKEKGPIGIQTLTHIFNHLDPDGRMNPTKLVP